MNELHSPESNIARQRKLDALFADQPFLSTTMRASRLHEQDPRVNEQFPRLYEQESRVHERAEPAYAEFALPPLPDDTDEVLRRMVEGRMVMMTRGPYNISDVNDDEWWTAPVPAITREPLRPMALLDPEPVSLELIPASRSKPSPKPSSDPAADGSRLFFDLAVELTPDGPRVAHLHPSKESPDVMTAREAAAYLRVSQATLRTWTRTHSVPHARLGRRLRYRRSTLLAWLAEWERTD